MNTTDFEFTIIEQDAARTLLNSISPTENSVTKNEILRYFEKDFSADLKVDWLPYMEFEACAFFCTDWEGVDGTNSRFNNSSLTNCSLENCDLKYINWGGTTFNKVTGKATSFDFSDFSNVELYDTDFTGCSFSDCFFYRAKFINCTLVQIEFTNTVFMEVEFESIDFTKVSFKNAEFRRCHFLNCVFPFFEILHISYGLKELLVHTDMCFKPVRTNHIVKSNEYFQEIHDLLPLFFSDKDYIAMANIYILEGDMEKAYKSIKNGLIFECKRRNFKLVSTLCKIASLNDFSFTNLKELYNILIIYTKIEELSNIEYYRYLRQLAKSEEMLFDSRNNFDIMYITLRTNYCYKETDKLASAIQRLYEIIEYIDNGILNKLVIRHNSPPIINLVLSGDFCNLILVFAMILYAFKKSTVFIEQIQHLIKNHNDIKLQKIDLKLKELELLHAMSEKQNKSKIVLPEDYSNISYIMKTAPDCPNALLRFELNNRKGIPSL